MSLPNELNLEQNLDVTGYISSHLLVPNEEDKNISIKITVQKMQTKTIRLSADQIKLENVKKGYTAELDLEEETVSVSLKGTKSALSGLTDRSFTGIVNCSGYGIGRYSIPIEINLGSDYQLEKEVYVKVVIRRK